MAVDSEGFIYLTDALMGTVRVFDSMGVDLGKVVEYGRQKGVATPFYIAMTNLVRAMEDSYLNR